MKYIASILGVIFFLLSPLSATAGKITTSPTTATPCENCGSTQVYTKPSCKLVSLYFVQEGEGAVAIRLYDADGKIIYDRYSKDRAFAKRESDTYSLCESVVKRATKVTITRCTPTVAMPITFRGNVLRAFIASKKNPVKLP